MRPNVYPTHTKLRGPRQVSMETKIQVGDLFTQNPPLYMDVKTSHWQDRPSIKRVFSAPHKQLFTEEDGTQKAERNICLMTHLQAVFSLLFSPFFCPRPALRSASPPNNTIKSLHHWWLQLHSPQRFMISNSWQMVLRLDCPGGVGGSRLRIVKKKERKVKKKGDTKGWGWGSLSTPLRNIFKVTIWAGWDFSNSILKQYPSPIKGTTVYWYTSVVLWRQFSKQEVG